MVEKGEDRDMEKRDMAEPSQDLPLSPLGSSESNGPGLAGATSNLGTTTGIPRVLVPKRCQGGSTHGFGLASHTEEVHP